MSVNRVLNRKKTDVSEAGEAIAIMTKDKIRKMESLFDYSTLENIPKNDIEDLKEIEKELINQGEQLGKVSFEIGKSLVAAKRIFAEEESSFMDWYSAIGLNKDQVSLFTGRYNLIIKYPQAKDMILNLSDVTIKETINKKTTENIKEKVFSGEIKTAKEIKEARKFENLNVKTESKTKKTNEIQECEIIEKRVFSQSTNIMRKIKNRMDEIELSIFENDGLIESNIVKLEEILNKMNELKL